MKRIGVLVVSLLIVAASNIYAEKAPQKIVDLANSTLASMGSDPVIVAAVKTENAKNKTLAKIKEMDKTWMNTAGIADFMKVMMESACGKHLRSIQASKPFYAEIFVTDNQGANVAMTDKTSDYWQGDEAKFKNCFDTGAGKVFVDDVEFDDSSQAYLVQVSVPVVDGGKAIGVIVFGLDVDKVE